MTEVLFDRQNTEPERKIRTRFVILYVAILVPLGWLGGVGVLSLRRGFHLSLSPLDFGVLTLALVTLGLFLGFLSARAIVFTSVPTAVFIDHDRIVGDFRRKGWKGTYRKEIRFEDIRAIRRAYLLRIPIVRGHPDLRRDKEIRDSAIFYLSDANLDAVRQALAALRHPISVSDRHPPDR